MGLLEKLKNTFFEEEYIEVEEEEKKKKEKPIAKKVEFKPKREEKKVEEVKEIVSEPVVEDSTPVEIYSDKELLKKDSSITYFEEDDFVEEVTPPPKPQEKVKLYGEDPSKLYDKLNYKNDNSYEPYSNSNKTGFKPTPVISPIYGILDKNYRKEEVIDKKDKPSSYVSRRNADLDFVRNKAFGSLEDDIMTNNISSLPIEDDEVTVSEEQNLLYDMTESNEPLAVEKVTIADAEEYFEDLGLEYNIDYKDSNYEKATGRRSKKQIKEEVSVEEEVPEVEVDDENNLEDNLFDLIDSMYEEKE